MRASESRLIYATTTSHSYGFCKQQGVLTGSVTLQGSRYRLKDMKKTWNGLLVGPDQWSPKHPQLMKKPTPIDPQALKEARLIRRVTVRTALFSPSIQTWVMEN